jgi:hypothetical protein
LPAWLRVTGWITAAVMAPSVVSHCVPWDIIRHRVHHIARPLNHWPHCCFCKQRGGCDG